MYYVSCSQKVSGPVTKTKLLRFVVQNFLVQSQAKWIFMRKSERFGKIRKVWFKCHLPPSPPYSQPQPSWGAITTQNNLPQTPAYSSKKIPNLFVIGAWIATAKVDVIFRWHLLVDNFLPLRDRGSLTHVGSRKQTPIRVKFNPTPL